MLETSTANHDINYHFTDKELCDAEELVKENGYESCSVLNIIPVDEEDVMK